MTFSGSGDEGYTSLLGGGRVGKDDPRIEALGALDEATSALGMARVSLAREASKPLVVRIQRELSVAMAEVASPDPAKLKQRIDADRVTALEADLAALMGDLPAWEGFTIPGDSRGAAALDFARAVVRRAERRVVRLVHDGYITNEHLVRYLNRLSALLYYLARADDRAAGVETPTTVKE